MSLFLGKIHYWLFDKIKWFEGLESDIVSWAEHKGLPVDNWKQEIYKDFGHPVEDKPLEDMIDTSNIHGWLQDKISKAEGRQAAWVTKILNSSKEYKNDLISIFEKQGNKLGIEYSEKSIPNSPQEIYNIINDFILEGMPCDRVTEELESDSTVYIWRTNLCLHSKYWDSVHGDVNNFYILRDAWITSFIKALNFNFSYNVSIIDNKRIQEIRRSS
ncbi:hypothetical protein Ccar_23430 [Clostridium carboxidivorans P7]|uniref:Uncharacterized protein n=1 Tax=Clostridium carboxidivorans P7 TaxID=536227 RepID=C6PNA1_9CLOT|nr:hypothetical protein [Clostridium carboxidivorans]AKN33610.1 hypothetical protein Ccar_23430 [Clostridium carboxidivorans P7]EET89222.1 conserved hypothetical protein [Clostridium carboxidivorans P7]EFG86801.1 hypothetical protein CLCAR_3758 [Clostridium carboxidivorans P7]